MAMVVGNTDVLTGLFNMKGLKQNYGSYLSKNENCLVIAFDFAKLKYINDNYGHAVGDSCLSNFGEVLKQNFYGDIIVRRSGDEFIVVTSKSPDEIEKALNGCISDIALFYELGDIQVKYSFNAGIVEASHGIDQTLEKADIIMYSAKKSGKLYEFYSDEVYNAAKKEERYLETVGNIVKDKSFNLEGQDIFKVNGEETNLTLFYTRNKDGKTIFDGNNLELLRKNYLLKKIDLLNLQKLFVLSSTLDGKLMINIHNQTLLNREFDFLEYISNILRKQNFNPKDIILSININVIDGDIKKLIEQIDVLRSFGFKICLDSFNFNGGSYVPMIWNMVGIDYIKFDDGYWKIAMNDKKVDNALKHTTESYLEYGTVPIFSKVETDNERTYVASLDPNCLVYGRNYAREYQIKNNS